MPPPPGPPGKDGISGAIIALIAVIGVVVLGGACVTCAVIGNRSKKQTTTTSKPEPPRKTPAPPPANDDWITAQKPYVKFHPPVGWSTEITKDKEWGIFKSPARDAVFAFTTFNQPGESTVRLGKAAGVLGVTDVDWRTPRHGTVGRDRFSARVADGTCNFKGPNGYIWYATVDSGTSDQMLLIFTVSASAPAARRAEAQAAIDSLQRR
ncbi:Hypothetical protein A7982_06226 [Minicystis rosea]|nr:Hypothetical protein A7982_06226 [Minicystis rosea]